MIPKTSAHGKFFREILKLIKGTKNKEGQDIEAGDGYFKQYFTKAWIPGKIITYKVGLGKTGNNQGQAGHEVTSKSVFNQSSMLYQSYLFQE